MTAAAPTCAARQLERACIGMTYQAGHATPVPRLYFTSATDSTAGSSPNTIAVAFSLRQTFTRRCTVC